MKKILVFFAAVVMTGTLMAGGLVTNTNQSALFTRFLSRNASTWIDAVYFNPAGLSTLGDGFYLSLNNQTIGQTKSILSNYSYLSDTPKEYLGNVSAPLFPGVYMAYNTGNWSFSAGFNPIGGGGGATYDNGLPSFEMGIADLVPLLSSQGFATSQYAADIFFEGSSIYFGYQGNIGYKINDMLSVAVGVRLVSASNTYQGHLKNIQINPTFPAFGTQYSGEMVLASDFFTSGAVTLNELATGASLYFDGLQQIVAGGGGSLLLTDGSLAGLSDGQIAQIQGIIGAAGQDITGLTIGKAQIILGAAAPIFAEKANTMSEYAAGTQDILVDAGESGMGYASIFSVNFTPSDNLNIAVKYESQTNLVLTTKVFDNKGGGIFSDGTTTIADMPALLAAGIQYKPFDKLTVSGSMNLYFDKNVDYDGSESLDINMIDKNFKEFAVGLEYGLTDKLRASAGWLGTYTGVNSSFQNDQRYSLNTNTLGGGLGFRVTDMLDLNFGAQYTFYQEGSKAYDYMLGSNAIPVIETYNKTTWVVAVGLDFTF
ncbi:MAG: aromatic hydrocarbon degradation protein [Bacteroidales bacterium]|nr:aromatic hydrocarbon degradation protein [Bacteroidales bacterium]